VLDFTDNSTNHALISAIDLMRPLSPEVRERARQIADETPGADPLAVIEQAEKELSGNAKLRANIHAKVTYVETPLDVIDWDALPLGEVSDYVLAKQLKVNCANVRYQRLKRGIQACPTEKPAKKEEKRTVAANVPQSQHNELQAAAAACGLSLSSWAATRLLHAARQETVERENGKRAGR
jgi:hypothetical protein